MFSLSQIGEVLKYLPRGEFDKIVREHRGDRYVKRFGCQQLLVTMICGQLMQARSLRQLEVGINQHRNHHYHIGLQGVNRSTLADANAKRKPVVFEELAKLLINLAGRSMRKSREEMLYLLDSTCIPLLGRGLQWAGQLATRIPGLRLHVLYASNQQLPVYFSITGENVPDVVECQRRVKSDPLSCEVAEVKLTHPGSFTSASRSRRAKPGATDRRPHRHAAGTVLLAA